MMKNRIFLTAVLSLMALSLSGQNMYFTLKKGNARQKVSYLVTSNTGIKTVRIIIGSMDSSQTIDSEYRTKEWRYTDKSDNTDVRITLSSGVYHVKGVLHGKSIDRTEKSEGYAWRQNFAYVCGHVLSGRKTSVYYECFLPRDMKLHSMKGNLMGEMNWAGNEVMRVKCNPTGVLAKLWSCDYYYDRKTLNLAGYKAVEGGPGTPETTWEPAK